MRNRDNTTRRWISFLASSLLCSLLVDEARSQAVSPNALNWQEPVVVATGPAHVGPWRMNDSEFHYVDDASAALREDGEVTVVWVDNERRDVFLQRYSAENRPRFDSPVNVSRSPEVFSWLPQALFSEEGHLYVVWQEIVFSGGTHGGEIFFARSSDGGQNFDAPLNLSQTIHGAGKGRVTEEIWDNGSLDMALGPQGTIAVAWTEYQGPLRVSRSTDGGRSFSRPTQVAGSQQRPARGPALDFGSEGELYLAWTLGEDREADIYLARSRDGGERFGSARVLRDTPGYSDTPSLAANAQGLLHVAYAENSEGFFGASQLRYLRLQGARADLRRIGILVSDTAGRHVSRAAPALALGPQDYVYVLWERHPDPGEPGRGLGFALSDDGGESFSKPLLVPGSVDPMGGINGSLQGKLGQKLAANRSGDVVVTNSHFLNGARSRIVLIRGRLAQ